MSEFRECYSKRLKQAISDAGASVTRVARITGIGEKSIYKYCDGSHVPGFDRMILLAKTLHVSLDWLCGIGDAAKAVTFGDDGMVYQEGTGLLKSYKCSGCGYVIYAKNDDRPEVNFCPMCGGEVKDD